MVEQRLRVCKKCGMDKPVDEYYPVIQRKDGRDIYCAPCRRKIYNEWRRRHRKKFYAENPEMRLWEASKRRAGKRGWNFNLEPKDIKIPQNCPVLGIPLKQAKTHASANSPSIDRINNEKGYVKNNIVVVSYKANTIKSNATFKELQAVVDFYKQYESV